MADDSEKHFCGFAVLAPAQDYGKQNTTTYVSRQGDQSNFHQMTSKTSYVDKQTGTYVRSTTKEVVSTGETFKETGSAGRVGTKNEYSTTDTYRVGDKSGYSEYQVQERFRRVDYGGSSSQGNYGKKGYCNGGNKYLK